MYSSTCSTIYCLYSYLDSTIKTANPNSTPVVSGTCSRKTALPLCTDNTSEHHWHSCVGALQGTTVLLNNREEQCCRVRPMRCVVAMNSPFVNSVTGNKNPTIKEQHMTGMPKRSQEAKRGSSSSQMDPNAPKMDIKSIMKDIEFLGSSHMTWKQRKELENRKVVSLGGKPQKTQKLPLSVARVQMKKQKEREQKMLQENAILGRFGVYHHTSGTKKVTERRRQEDTVLKSTEGHFRNGVLDVKSLLKPSAPRATNESSRHVIGKGKKKKGGKKSHGKRKNGGKKRH
ncbi:unnamed protein product [Fraxinus pennsylvanica]|uniref:Uncharacterized protein n=1 Tax=Fraxinus pennsylvanica TaxID=56036 RepID=A0AAD1YRB1_9LAMI|nr:unnamed protein product [Fraxinus pennsylvanica]